MKYTAEEQQLRDHLHSLELFPGEEEDMFDIIINSFYTECELDNDDEWEVKISYTVKHFDLFKAYVQDMWVEDGEWPDFEND